MLGCSNASLDKKNNQNNKNNNIVERNNDDYKDDFDKAFHPTIPKEALNLIKAYPEQRLKYRDNKIFFPDGVSFVYDDKKAKDFVTKLDNSDLEDMFSVAYDTIGNPDYLSDGGRIRCDQFFKKMYGCSEREVKKHLVDVNWFGQRIKFTSVNKANQQLEKVAKEINCTYPNLVKYMRSCGSFYWRKVRGANRQSAHSYGIAIDINTAYADYWLWKNGNIPETKKISYNNRIPLEIVRVFEKYGFVWGGRWYHYDTMHFEYRPEINPIK